MGSFNKEDFGENSWEGNNGPWQWLPSNFFYKIFRLWFFSKSCYLDVNQNAQFLSDMEGLHFCQMMLLTNSRPPSFLFYFRVLVWEMIKWCFDSYPPEHSNKQHILKIMLFTFCHSLSFPVGPTSFNFVM